MKILILVILVSYVNSQNTGTLFIKIKGISSHDGNLRIALSNSESSFLTENPYKVKFLAITTDTVVCQFDSLIFNHYALQLFQDEDLNGELNTNFIGIPTEPYAFSNDAKGSFGPPTFKDATFVLNKDTTLITLNLNE
jgi:uncharacterized protein (DUF2141 family)